MDSGADTLALERQIVSRPEQHVYFFGPVRATAFSLICEPGLLVFGESEGGASLEKVGIYSRKGSFLYKAPTPQEPSGKNGSFLSKNDQN